MKIEHSFEVPVPVSEAWAMLMNIEDVVGCLPGARLGEFPGLSECHRASRLHAVPPLSAGMRRGEAIPPCSPGKTFT